jgi:hypothetical protein
MAFPFTLFYRIFQHLSYHVLAIPFVDYGLNIVQMHQRESVQIWSADFVHQHLEGRRSVYQPEWRDQILVLFVTCVEVCFRGVLRFDTDLPVSNFQLYLRENFRVC